MKLGFPHFAFRLSIGTVETPVCAEDDLRNPNKLEGNEGRLAELVLCISADSTSKK